MNVDSANNRFEEVPLPNGEKVRITHIEKSWDGGAGLRLQIREENGHLRPGPEIPEGNLAAVITATVRLVIQRNQDGPA